MKKKVIIVSVVVILLILLVPIPFKLKDGGTIEYKSLTYKVSKVHRLLADVGYEDGLIIEAFGIELYNNVKPNRPRPFNNEELSNMALEYFFKTGEILLPKEEYHVGIDNKVIPKYQNQDIVVIEIRHINNNINNTLDARYYINVYTAKGFDDLENEIDLNDLERYETQETENVNEVTEISLGEKAWINSLTKINIKDTNDYFEITEKVKWEVPEYSEDTTISFAISIPYTFVVDGGSYSGIYELNDASWSKKPEGLDYNLRVVNLTKDGKIEIEVTK